MIRIINISNTLKLIHWRTLSFKRHNSSLMKEARERLSKIGGGKMELEKDEESQIAVITINNPEKRNAISGAMMTQLEEIVSSLESWETGKGVVLQSTGDIFCSGGDISELNKDIKPYYDGLLLSFYMQNILTRLFSLPLISVTLVHGKAIGGGAELTTSTDFRVFTESGEISFVQGRMGVTTGWGGGTRLVKILGPRISLDLLASSRKLKCDEALKIGYADTVIESKNDPSEKVKNWLSDKLIHHHSVLQAVKKMVVGARDLSFENSLKNESEIFSLLWGGPVNLEALSKNIKHK